MAEWISTKDRLPETDGMYLIFAYGREIFLAEYTGQIKCGGLKVCGETWDIGSNGGMCIVPIEEVSHWMPLPAPPKAEA